MNKNHSISALALMATLLSTNVSNAQDSLEATNDNAAIARENSLTPSAGGDEQVLLAAARSNAYSRAITELAVQKAQNEEVQRYAAGQIDDHDRFQKVLSTEASKRGIELPLVMSGQNQGKLQLLVEQNPGREFDVAYLKEELRINTANILQANAAIKASSDKKFRGLMNDYALAEQKQLNLASRILSALQKNSPALTSDLMDGTSNSRSATNTVTPEATNN